MIETVEELEIELTEPAKRFLDLLERILDMNERALKIIETVGATPIMVKTSPNQREG